MAALRYRAGHYIFALWFLSFSSIFLSSLFSWPNLSGRRVDVYHTSTQIVALPNLGCRSETCSTQLSGNTGYKKSPKSRHMRTVSQICRAISSQVRHVSTIGKKTLFSSDMSSRCPHNMVNFGLLSAEIVSLVWGTIANFNGFRVLVALLHGTLVVGVSQTLRR